MAEQIIQGRQEREYGAVQETEESIAQAPLPQEQPLNVNLPLPQPSLEPPSPKSMVSVFTPNLLFGPQNRPQSPNQHRRNVGMLWEALAKDPESPTIIRLVADRMLGRDRYADR